MGVGRKRLGRAARAVPTAQPPTAILIPELGVESATIVILATVVLGETLEMWGGGGLPTTGQENTGDLRFGAALPTATTGAIAFSTGPQATGGMETTSRIAPEKAGEAIASGEMTATSTTPCTAACQPSVTCRFV